MKKRYYLIYAFLIVIAFILLFLLSSKTNFFLNGNDQEQKQYAVAVVVKSRSDTPAFWKIVGQGVKAAADEFNVKYEIYGPDEEKNIAQQIMIVEDIVKKKPDALLLAASDYIRLSEAAQKAVDAGIRLITIDSDVMNQSKLCFVGTDNIELGHKLGQTLDSLLGKSGRYGVVGHIKGVTTAIDREKGVLESIYQSGQRLAGIDYCNGSVEASKEITKKMLSSHPEIKGMIGLNESSALGIAYAVSEMGLSGKVKIVACDSSLEQIKLMEQGVIQAFVVQRPFNMGYIGVKMAADYLNNKKIPSVYDTGSVVVTPETVYLPENQKLLFPFVNQ